jgi:type I restriction enzyme, S subunit
VKFERYRAYKDSGVEWLGDVPEHWEIARAKSMFNKMSRCVSLEDKIITVFRDGQVTLRENRRETGFTNAIEEYGYQGLRKGDLVFHAMDAFAGAIGVSDSDGKATPEYLVYTPIDSNKIYVLFYGFLLRQMALSGFVLALGKSVRERSPRFKHTKFVTLELPIPPFTEQKTIAHYLDTKIAQCDRKIDLLAQKAKLYGDLKQSLINETVTRGLDKSVPMKDSAIEWIGDVPEHWEIKRVKDIAKSINGGAFKEGLADSGIPIIKINQLTSQSKPVDFCDPNFSKINRDNKLKNGDLVFSWSTLIAPFIYVGEDALLNQHIFKIQHSKNVSRKWLFYKLTQSISRLIVSAHGSTMQHILKSDFDNLEIQTPPFFEQKAIAHYLDTKTAQIDQIIQTINTQIEKLKELRKTLINDVVTGKIKV